VNPFDFSPADLFTSGSGSLDNPAYLAMAIVFGIALLVAAFAWIAAPRLFADHRFRQRVVTRLAITLFTFAAVGLLLLLFRWQGVPLLSWRIWLVVWWLAAIGTSIYIWYFLKRVYPKRLAAWLDAERRRRYMPKPGSGQQRGRRRSRRNR
jgi:drug/metabolite transporter (DMT)-like permease